MNRFLNVKHGKFVRLVVGLVLFLSTLILTFQPLLAQEAFRRVYQHNSFKTAFRRVSFYARRSWLKLDVSRDQVFVFCDGLVDAELDAAAAFLVGRQKAIHPGIIAGDLSYIYALKAIECFGTAAYPTALDAYSAAIGTVLSEIQSDKPHSETLKEPAGTETFDKDSAREALVAFKLLMEQSGISWFVLSGTFLGAVREGDFLAHDYDLDVGIHADEQDIFELRKLLAHSVVFQPGAIDNQIIFKPTADGGLERVNLPVFMKVVHANGIHLDVFVHYNEERVIWHGSSLFRWDNQAFGLAPIDLSGVEVTGPDNPDQYLTENYGDWRTPKPKFQSSLDTTNQNLVRNPLSVAIFLRRIWLSQATHPEGAGQLLGVLLRQGYLKRAGDTQSLEFDPAPFEDAQRNA